MKLLKLSAVFAAMAVSTGAFAAEPYEYDSSRGIISNTTGALVGTTKTVFDTAFNPGSVNAEIGTLGYGAGLSWSMNDSTELVAGWNGGEYDDDVDLDHDDWINWNKVLGDGFEDFRGNLDYDADLNNPYLGLQMRPFGNSFTVGTGVLVPNNDIQGIITADRQSELEFNNHVYEVREGGKVAFKVENDNKLAPYATLGFRPNIDDQWGIFGEVGAAYMGDVTARAAVESGTVVGGSTATEEQLARDVEKELNDNDELWYPIAKLGVSYRF